MSEKIIKFPSSFMNERGFFEKLGFEIYDKLNFVDEEEKDKFKKSMILYSEFLEIINDENDGDEVEDESIMDKLFSAIKTSKYNVEARIMEINMRGIPEYEREQALLALRDIVRDFDEGSYSLQNGEINIFYLRTCAHLGQFYLDNEVYAKVKTAYDIFYNIGDFSDNIFNVTIYQRLAAAIYLNDETQIKELFDLAEEYGKEYDEMILLSKVFYYLSIRNEDLAFEYLEDLQEENQFTKNYIIRLFNSRLPSLYARDRQEARDIRRLINAFSYYILLLEGDYFYEFLVNMSTEESGDFTTGVDLLKRMKNDPIFNGVNDKDLEILCNVGYVDALSFLDVEFSGLLKKGVKVETIERLIENGVEFESSPSEINNIVELFTSFKDFEDSDENVSDEDSFDEEAVDEGKNIRNFVTSKKEDIDFSDFDDDEEKVKTAWEYFSKEFGKYFSSEAEEFEVFKDAYEYGLFDGKNIIANHNSLLIKVERILKENTNNLEKILKLEELVAENSDLVKKVANINEKYYSNSKNSELKQHLEELNQDFDHKIVNLPIDIVREYPKSSDQLIALHALGNLYFQEKLYKKAKECFEVLVCADVKDILETRHLYALVLTMMNELDHLLEILKRYNYELDESILLSLIICYINEGNMPKAYDNMKLLKKLNSHIGELFNESSNLLKETNFEKLSFALKNIEHFTFDKYYYDYLNLIYHMRRVKKEDVVGVIDDPIFSFLTKGVIAALALHNITSKEDLEKYSEKEILAIKGVGKKTIAILKRNGVEFKD